MAKVYFDKDLRAATPEQAKLIAVVWANEGRLPVANFKSKVVKELIELEWLSNTGIRGTFPNGAQFDLYVLKPDAMCGLEKYLRNVRLNKGDDNASDPVGVTPNQTPSVRLAVAAAMDVQE